MNREGVIAWKELWITGVSLLLVLGPAAVALRAVKNIPSQLQESQENVFETIAAAESALGVKILLPSYFPEFLVWPASEVKVFRKEALTIRFVFLLRKDNTAGLIVYQILKGEEPGMPEPVELGKAEHQSFVTVNHRTAKLFLSSSVEGQERYGLVWDLADRRMILLATFPKQQLLTLAGSIH